MANHLKDLTGQRFNRWLVLSRSGLTPNKISTWNVRCDCGKEKIIRADQLRNGTSQSCGCLARELSSIRNGRHCCSYVKTPEYVAWCSARQRCNNPNSKDYPDYGGRGIKFDPRWNDFLIFSMDMGQRPSPNHSLDRIDNDGDYTVGNCRWATKKEQQNNRRTWFWGINEHKELLASL